MDLGIKGKSALVFGGSRGIGRAVAGALAVEGANVAVCARKEWAARKVASEAAERGGVEAAGYPLDAWDEPSAIALIRRVTDDFGAIDILFGIARRPKLEDRDALSWKTRLDHGLFRFKAATETLLPAMQHRKWGRMLWMIPWAVPQSSAEKRLDSVTNAALSGWLESAAMDVAHDNVTLNILKPAPVWKAAERSPSPGNHEPGTASKPAGATLSVPEVAAVATFLLSEHTGGLCGKTIELGGVPSRAAAVVQAACPGPGVVS